MDIPSAKHLTDLSDDKGFLGGDPLFKFKKNSIP